MSESLLDDTALEEENVHNVTKSDRKSVNCNEGASHDESLYNSEDCKESKESISFVHEKIDNDKVELNDKRGNPEEESVDLKSMSHGSRATDGAGDKNIEVEGEVMVPEVPITTAEGENLVREEKDMSEEKENVDTGRETMTTEGGEIGAEGGTYQCNDNAESTKKKRNRKNRFLNCFGSKSDSDHSDEDISSELIEKFKDDKESLFDYFWQSNSVFSQWYKIKFVVDDVEYNCAEQYMMHQKALLMEDGDNAEIVMALDDPQEQKSVGRLVENWNEELWLKHRLNIVKKGNIAKFSQNSELLQELISTFPKILVEASPYDKVWGIGLRAHDKRAHNRAYWKGENLLGYILTEVRDEIMREHGMMEDSTHLTKDSENAASQNISSPFQKTSDFECTPKTENDENTEDSLSVVTTNENISNTDDTQPVLLSPNDNGKYTEESKVMPMDVKEEHNQEVNSEDSIDIRDDLTV